MLVSNWISNNYIEIFGAVTGIIFVFLEIRQALWLWPVGIVTSAVYIWVFFTGKLYADMSLQGYYLIISCLGWYWWAKSKKERRGEEGNGRKAEGEPEVLQVTRLEFKTGAVLGIVFIVLFLLMWVVLSYLTDSPVPGWDSFITSLSIIATWMLARKIYEHWILWIVINSVAVALFVIRGLYPTVILYLVYGLMSFVGIFEWRKTMTNDLTKIEI